MTIARRHVEAPAPGPMLRIWIPEGDGAAHRIPNPVRKPEKRSKSNPDQRELFAGVSDDVLAAVAAVERDFRDQVVPENQRAEIAARTSLRQFWLDWLLPDQERRVAAGKLSRASLAKTRQALNRWERFTRPDNWNKSTAWPGWPIGAVTSRFATTFLERLQADPKISAASARSTWGHLRTIFNHAARIRAIDVQPKPEPVTVPKQKTAIFTDQQIQSAYLRLYDRRHVSLQVAFVLAINAGIRPVDLFLLRWSDFTWGDRPSVTFTARKTGKPQTLPLAAVTLQHLARLPSAAKGYLFGHLTDVAAKDPERSRLARRRNAEFKEVLASVGITFPKPWQACRATCNERLESHREGAGQFMLGHGSTLNSKSYREPSKLIYEAVNSVPQPACFFTFERT